MKRNFQFLPILCMIVLCSCKSGNASNQGATVAQDTIKSITLPTIPQMLTTPEQRADFLVKHYWDNVNFTDTNYIHHPDLVEQSWVDYCDIMKHIPLDKAQEAIQNLIKKTAVNKKVFKYFTELADKYLYDPNSPMRNEEYYIPVLEVMTTTPILNETEKIRPEARLKLAQKNRIGTKALNFTYTLASGTQGSLYQLQAEYILLFINNPGCHACSETIASLKTAIAINQRLKAKKLILLSIYPDQELEEWRNHQYEFPKEWISGYDKKFTITEKELYDLKAIPTLYLLNKEKVVLLKDVTTENIEEYLSKH